MNIQQVIFFAISSLALSQNQRQQYYADAQSVATDYYNSYYPTGQYAQQYYSANSKAADNSYSYRQDRIADRQQAVSSVSSYFKANSGSTNIPDDVIASYLATRSSAISQRIDNASSFMATQTQINTASVAQAISSFTATATSKTKKGLFHRIKATKTKTTATGSITATSTSGMGKGFKSFFKSIQLKIQKSSTSTSTSTSTGSSTSSITPTATSS